MEKSFITAQEAKEKATNYSNINQVCDDIQRSAERGLFRASFMFLSKVDIAKLIALGYDVVEEPTEKFPFTVSWG